MSLTKMKAQTQSRMTQQKRTTQRKRNIIVLIQKYLLSLGYLDSVTKIQQQTNISLDKYDTADNIDLYMIIMEFQQFYQMKFNKPPKLCKVTNDKSMIQQMKKAALKTKDITNSINKEGNLPPYPSKPDFKKKNSLNQKSQKTQKSQKNIQVKSQSMQIQGNSMSSNKQKKKQDQDQLFDVRVLKGIPDYSSVPQYRQLAAYLQRDILVQNPNVKFQDIVGLEDAKRLLKQAVLLPLKYSKLFTGLLEPWKGVLLFGPPGTGKTMLAKSVATQCKTTFFNISASSVVSKWRGQSQKLIRVLFELARWYQPSTIFIDEIDSIMSQRGSSGAQHQGGRRMKTQLLIQMDGVIKKNQRVFLLAASNLPWDLDIAMLRRLQKRILVDLPCLQARQSMLKMYLPQGSMANSLEYQAVAKNLQGYSGSDIKLVCKEAAMKPLRRLLQKLQQIQVKQSVPHNKFKKSVVNQDQIKPQPVNMNDLLQAVKTTKKSPGLQTKKYMNWVQEFGSV